MIIHTSQLHLIEDIEGMLEKYKVKPVAIRGTRLNFYWPPQPTGVPINLFEVLPARHVRRIPRKKQLDSSAVKSLQKKKIVDLPLPPEIKEVLTKVLGPNEEVYVEILGGRIRIIL
jgi:hypothetical protein